MGLSGRGHAPAALPPRKRPSTLCIGRWVGRRAGLDRCGKSRPHWDSIPGPSSPYPVAIPTELSRPIIRPETKHKESEALETGNKFNGDNTQILIYLFGCHRTEFSRPGNPAPGIFPSRRKRTWRYCFFFLSAGSYLLVSS